MQTVPRPDVDELISGGRVRRRRRNQGRVAVAAAVAVLLAGGAYGVTLIDSTTKAAPADTSKPSRSAEPQSLPTAGGSELQPGTYRMLAGVGATGAALEADLTLDGAGWTDGNYPVVSDGTHTAGVAVYRPQALAAGSGCNGDNPNSDVGETSPALARQLAQLPRSTVVQAATQQRAFGRDTVHLRLRIDDRCTGWLPGGGSATRQSWRQLQRRVHGCRHRLLGRGRGRRPGRGRRVAPGRSAERAGRPDRPDP